MFRTLSILSAALSVCLVSGSLLAGAAAQAAEGSCPSGRLTLARIAAEGCIDRIPLPVLRPVAAHIAVQPDASAPVFEYAEFSGADGTVRKVRLVGPRFLPDEDEAFDAAFGPKQPTGWDAVVSTAASWFGVASAHADTAEQPAPGSHETAAGRASGHLVASR